MKNKMKIFFIVVFLSAIFTFLSLNMIYPKKVSELSLSEKNCTEWRGIFIPHREDNIIVDYTMQNSGTVYDLVFWKWNFTTVSNEYYNESWDKDSFFDRFCAEWEE